jgi:hypothetical protein
MCCAPVQGATAVCAAPLSAAWPYSLWRPAVVDPGVHPSALWLYLLHSVHAARLVSAGLDLSDDVAALVACGWHNPVLLVLQLF